MSEVDPLNHELDESKLLPCSVCGVLTEWCCADCRIDTGKSVHVCSRPECRDKHEEMGNCTKPSLRGQKR